uniref:CAP-Gly domain-containing protein n=3 Tax=Hemiselmis andersenii TaxID=464988 RepID=A0A6U2HZ95_HEMAN|mmetsp:Transcript_4533/g.10399  ORF Transcript_4533/g.10399 Transcript_4533/m.10399 type:complete len:350 (+) Transcript_4533:152-1201(+)
MPFHQRPRGDGRGGVAPRYLGDGRGGHVDITHAQSAPSSVPGLDLSRVSSTEHRSSSPMSQHGVSRVSSWVTPRTRVCLDPISLKREKHGHGGGIGRLASGDIMVFDDPEREKVVSPLPDLKKKVRGMAIGLRTDGMAAMVPGLQVYPKKGMSPFKAGLMKEKTDNALAAIHNRLRVQNDFHNVIEQVVHKTKRLPKLYTNVVVRLNKPFLGYRAEGRVMYIGAVPEEGPGVWLGLALEKGVGMHDGMGYFKCTVSPGSQGPFYGVFVRGSQIEFCDRLTDNLHEEGVRLLPPQAKNLRSLKFWKDPFRLNEYPPLLKARPNAPVVPGLSVTNTNMAPDARGSGFHTAR